MAMNKAAVYTTLAVVLGLAMTLIPSWLFLSGAANDYKGAVQLASDSLPLLESREENHVALVSHKDLGVLGASFLFALTVYGIYRARTRHQGDLG
jgi:hypothetical protein